MTDAEKAYQYFVIAVPENEEQAKAYFWARKALQSTFTPPNEWVSVEERLPEHLKDVLALYGNGRIDIDWVDSSGNFKFGSLFDGVTHWMLLPAPPDRRPPERAGNA